MQSSTSLPLNLPSIAASISQLPPYVPRSFTSAPSTSTPRREENAVPSTSSNGRVLPSLPLPPLHPTASALENDAVGTAENPLIPKRRRRTTPAELAILEQEYHLNQRPDQPERAKIALRLGMTNRAIQVWYQNRRQKDKKDSSSNAGSSRGSSVASGDLSSPKDLDGVTLSFSSSPVPSPQFPNYTSTAPSRPPLVAASSSVSLKGLPSSSDLYSTGPPPAADKENASLAPLESLSPTEPAPKPYVYSYPSSKESIAAVYQFAQSSSNSSSSPSSSAPHQPVFVHRSSDSSIIAAKKHVRKRPLGSHAPIARTPSLSHVFAFPPSPPKSQKSAPAPLRSSSVGCLPSNTAAKLSLADLTAQRPELGRRASSLNRSTSSLFDLGDSEVKKEEPVRSVAPMEQGDEQVAGGSVEGENGARKAAADDLLGHMESDPPSASSPVAVMRTRIIKPSNASIVLTAADEDSDEDDKTCGAFVPSAFASRRPPLQHTQSLDASHARLSDSRGGDPSKAKARVALLRSNSYSGTSSSFSSPLSISTSLANSHARSNPFSPLSAPLSSRTIPRKSPSLNKTVEAARAGTDNACALTALGRKREKFINDSIPLSLPSLPVYASSSSSSRRRSQDPTKERATKRRRSSALSSISSTAGEDSMGELSFSSTSTNDSLATIDSPPSASSKSFPGSYFALKTAVEQVEAKDSLSKAGDDERECAELLLGLGGFF
ncbi:hypothetical protein JCM16303_000557 [Sporobolomyces ruberrimus]